MKIFDTTPKSGSPVRLKSFYTAMLRMARAWEKLAVHNGHVDWSDGMPTIVVEAAEGGDSGLDLSKCALGYKIDPNGNSTNTVRIYAGEIDRHEVAQTDVAVGNGTYIYVKRKVSDNTMTVETGMTVPEDGEDEEEEDYLYYRLYRFSVASGVATIWNIYRPFDIEVNKSGVIPAGGTQYQVLQRDAALDPVWDWVRWV